MVKIVLKYLLLLPALILFPVILSTGCNSDFEVLFDEGGNYPYRVFWSESNGSISRASTDLAYLEEILVTAGTPLDMALYLPGNRVYWTEDTGALFMIRNAYLDGSDISTFITYDSADYYGPLALAINSGPGYIYWNRYQAISDHNDIWRSILSTASPEKLYNDITDSSTATLPYTYAMAVDRVNNTLLFNACTYWSTGSGTTLGSGSSSSMFTGNVNTVDSDSEQFAATGPSSPSVPLRGIAVDNSAGYIYYVEYTTANPVIKRTDLDLQNEVPWITASGFDIQKIALDTRKAKIYWTSPSDNSIYRANLGEADSGIEKFIQLESTPTGIAIAN